MMGGPWRSVPDLLYESYASGELRRNFPSDPGFGYGDRNTFPSHHSQGTGHFCAKPSCPYNALCLKSTLGDTSTFVVAKASLNLLPNGHGDDKMCLGHRDKGQIMAAMMALGRVRTFRINHSACKQYHLRRQEPITRQPQSKNSRPQYMKVTSDWSTDLFACMEDQHTCLLGALCSPCLACSLARQLGESCCVVTCVPGGIFAMRTKLRIQQNIEGSICDDCLTLSCCCPFALCQMARELDNAEIGRLR